MKGRRLTLMGTDLWIKSLNIWTRECLLKHKGGKELFTSQIGNIMELSFQKLVKMRNLNSGQS